MNTSEVRCSLKFTFVKQTLVKHLKSRHRGLCCIQCLLLFDRDNKTNPNNLVDTVNIAEYKGSLNQIEFFATLTRIPTLKHCIQSECAAVLNLILKRREISLTYFEPVR